MSKSGLLPEGLRDVLPPYAQAEALLLRQVMDTAASHGYERVSPPLVEFEDSLVGRVGFERGQDLFRFMDPLSQRTLALRMDMTPQIARIASHRLGHLPRPLRLSYGGVAVRVKGTQLRADRQFIQAGAELIGTDGVAAAVEVVQVALDSLTAMGLEGVTLDLTMPALVQALLAERAIGGDLAARIAAALDAKDSGALASLGASWASPLIAAAGPLDQAGAALPADLAARLADVFALADALRASHPQVPVTLDPAEQHGFAYQTWLGFSLFARGVRGEVGRGGAYRIHGADGDEPAVGFSLFIDGLVDAGRGVQGSERVFLAPGTSAEAAAELRARGLVTVAALEAADLDAAAQAQRCAHVFENGALRPLAGPAR